MCTCKQTELANKVWVRVSVVFTIFMLLTIAVRVSAQDLVVVKGRVLDEETEKPLPYASVFLNNSTFGAVADENGEFDFFTKPGNYDLIVNFFFLSAHYFSGGVHWRICKKVRVQNATTGI